ncbi:MAG: DUF4091 domain-containing protein [Clostridia bacterium]|nr:DUF4091 domain-containing protein [Clostridia bacterium]
MNFKIVSSLCKARLTDKAAYFSTLGNTTALLGDRLFFSAVCDTMNLTEKRGVRTEMRITSDLSPYIKVYQVENVPVRLPHYPDSFDGDYIGHEPGLYPDLLRPIQRNTFYLMQNCCTQLYFELNVPKNMEPGSYTVTIELFPQNIEETLSASLQIDILPAVIPEQSLTYTQWFHYDCLATHYGVEIFSERHWEIIENFVKTAVKTGITALLTPIFTPPLDTEIGGERPTVQLVDITVENGKYIFGFDKLKRFCEMCHRCGMPQLEIAHFFTQWGAEHAPKIMATMNGEYRRIFGWDTDAAGTSYVAFLHEFIPAVRQKLDEFGYQDKYFFHISDEPNTKHLKSYKAAKEAIWPLICDRPVRDALSHFEFYEEGIVRDPIPSVKSADTFVENCVPDLWVYYCCSPGSICSNRFIAMSGNRARIIGAQMFHAGVTGFLHWGYNFYYSRHSYIPIDPYTNTDGDYFVPAGDTFTVYPSPDGTALQSLRSALFEQAIFDMRAMALAEEKMGRAAVSSEIEAAGINSFKTYSKDPEKILSLRDRINHMAAGV